MQPQLKRLANAKPAQPRSLSSWLLSGRDVLLELPLYAALTARILLPCAAVGMLSAANPHPHPNPNPGPDPDPNPNPDPDPDPNPEPNRG